MLEIYNIKIVSQFIILVRFCFLKDNRKYRRRWA